MFRLLKNAEKQISDLKDSRGGDVKSYDESALRALLEKSVAEVQEDADRRVAQAEEAARTAQEALKMIMSIQNK